VFTYLGYPVEEVTQLRMFTGRCSLIYVPIKPCSYPNLLTTTWPELITYFAWDSSLGFEIKTHLAGNKELLVGTWVYSCPKTLPHKTQQLG